MVNNNNLNRVEFLSKNKIRIDGKINVLIENKQFVLEDDQKKCFKNDKLLFDYIEEMTTTDSVGGGMELPFTKAKNKPKPVFPYTTIVETAEKIVKKALIEEFIYENSFVDLLKIYQDTNKQRSEENIQNVQNGIKIVYAEILPSMQPTHYVENSDYNGDGIQNQYKENNTLLDLQYDGPVPQVYKDKLTDHLSQSKVGQEMMDSAAKKQELKDGNPVNNGMVQLGSDIEFQHNDSTNSDKKEDEQNKTNKLGFNTKQPVKESTIKFKFKKTILTENNIVANIPEKVKKTGTIFEMMDIAGNEYKLLWENEKKIKILSYSNKKILEESEKKREKLSNYTRTDTKNNMKINESEMFKNFFNKK